MADDNRIKLGLDLTDTAAKAKELAGSLSSVKYAAQGVADTYEVLGDTYDVVEHQIVHANTQVIASAGRAATAKRDMGEAAESASKKMGGLSRAALQTSQALQDVAQGGLASGLNNVDGIVGNIATGLGFTATAAATASAAILGIGTVALVAAPAIKGLWQDLTAYGGQLPPATDALVRLNDELKVHKDRLADVKSRDGLLSPKEIEDYAKAQMRVLAIEKDIADQRETEVVEKGLRGVNTDAEMADRAKQAKRLKDAVAAEQDDLITIVKQKSADYNDAVMDARDRLAKAVESRNDFLSSPSNAILHPFLGAELKKGVQDAEKELVIAMRHAGLEGMKSLKDAFAGDNKALQDVIRIVGPDSDFGKSLQKALRESWKPGDVLAGMGERAGKVLDTFSSAFQKQTEKAFKEQEKLAEDHEKAMTRIGMRVSNAFEGFVEAFTKKTTEQVARINEELAKLSPNQFEGIETPLDLALAFDDNGNPVHDPNADAEAMGEEARMAGVRRRSALRKPVRQIAESFGVDLSKEDIEAAAGMADFGQGQGMMQGDAIMAAIQQIILNQQMMANQGQQDNGRVKRMMNEAQRVPSLLQFGTGW